MNVIFEVNKITIANILRVLPWHVFCFATKNRKKDLNNEVQAEEKEQEQFHQTPLVIRIWAASDSTWNG